MEWLKMCKRSQNCCKKWSQWKREKKRQKAKGTTNTGAKAKEKSSNSKRSKIIVEIYGHELYRGIDAGLNGSM
jgi:hypothetical protein